MRAWWLKANACNQWKLFHTLRTHQGLPDDEGNDDADNEDDDDDVVMIKPDHHDDQDDHHDIEDDHDISVGQIGMP